MFWKLLSATLLTLGFLQGCSKAEPADLIVFGGRVLTVDKAA